MKQIRILVVSIIAILSLAIILTSSTSAYTTDEISKKLRSGVQTAINWDTCRYNLTSGSPSDLRAQINGGCSYGAEVWLSASGFPNTIAPVDVAYNATSVKLQINGVRFLAGSLVEANLGHVAPLTVRNDASRWVTSLTNANDRRPNPIGNKDMLPAMVDTYRKVTSVSVKPQPDGTVIGSVTKDAASSNILETRRNDSTRYWFASPIGLTYTNNDIVDGSTVTILVKYKEINSFYNPWNSKKGKYYDIYCTNWYPALGYNGQYINSATGYDFYFIDNCAENTISLDVTFHKLPPPYNYSLEPTVKLNRDGVVEVGSSITATPKINNSGPTGSAPSSWELTRIVVQPGGAVPNASGGISPDDPCGNYFKTTELSICQNVSKGSNVTFSVGDTPLGDVSTGIDDLAVGTRICYALSVKPNSSTDSQWRHSAPACVVIGKNPKIQILGGDLWVGVPFSGSLPTSKIDTGTVTKNGATFGSWIEYGIFATGTIKGAGSGAAYSGQGLVNPTVCLASKISFSNATSSTACTDSTSIGSYTSTKIMPDVEASFPKSSAVDLGSNNLLDSNMKSDVYTTSASSLTLSGGTLAVGHWIVLSAPDTDVTINGNIMYTGDSLTSISDIPQLVIIAKNIYITDNVNRVDAWLIAKSSPSGSDGTINTCSSVSGATLRIDDPLTTEICNQQLVINGPVMANKLYLRRTFGSNPCVAGDCSPSGIPAEIFNLRPDAYLWASARSIESGRLQTVFTTELPPRL